MPKEWNIKDAYVKDLKGNKIIDFKKSNLHILGYSTCLLYTSPLSTPERPKQLLKIFSDKTMIRETVDRILPIIEAENIFIATNIIQAKEIEKELSDIPKENIIIEPAFKDTAAAIGYSSLIIENRFKNRLKDGEKLEVVAVSYTHLTLLEY